MLRVIGIALCFSLVASFNEDKLRDELELKVRQARSLQTVAKVGTLQSAKNFLSNLGQSGQIGKQVSTGVDGRWASECLYGQVVRPTWNPITHWPIFPTRFPIFPKLPVQPVLSRRAASKTLNNRDYVFVLDTSGSISNAAFDQAKEGIVTLVSSFCPSGLGNEITAEGNKQVSLVLFGSQVETEITFGDSHRGLSALRQQIQQITHRRGGATRTADALKHVREQILKKGVSRTGNGQVSTDVIVVTDGRCNQNCQSLAKESDALRKAGANLFALGIDNIRACELEIITGKGSDAAFGISDFKEFTKFTDAVGKLARESKTGCV